MSIFGKRGRGKSYLMKRLIRSVSKSVLMVVYDFKHEYHGMKEIPDINKFDWNTKTGAFRYKSKRTEADFNHFCKIGFSQIARVKSRRCIFVFDELQRFIKTNTINTFQGFADMLFVGRAYGIAVWCATQRPAKVDNSVLSQSDVVISFFMDLKSDLKYVEEYFDPAEHDIKSLPPFHFFMYSTDGVERHDPIP